MVLQSEMGNIIAQRHQEMIITIMARPEQRACLDYQLMKMHLRIRRHGQRRGTVGSEVHEMRWILARRQLDGAEIFSGNHWRIHQRVESNRREVNCRARLLRPWQ